MTYSLSIVIVTYNSINLIEECIDSILLYNDLGQTNLEIVISDNSDDFNATELELFLNNKYGNQVNYFHNKSNLGYGYGNNLGIARCKSNFVAVMNPDVRLCEPLFKDGLKSFSENEKLAFLGYKQMGGVNLSFFFHPEYYFSFLNALLIRFCNAFNLFNPRFHYLSGAFFLIDKKKFEHIGLFDEKIFLFFEEPDIIKRCLKSGYDVKYNPEFCYQHLVENRGFSQKSYLIWLDALKYYCQKHHYNIHIYLKKLRLEYQIKIFYGLILKKRSLVEHNKYLKRLLDSFSISLRDE